MSVSTLLERTMLGFEIAYNEPSWELATALHPHRQVRGYEERHVLLAASIAYIPQSSLLSTNFPSDIQPRR